MNDPHSLRIREVLILLFLAITGMGSSVAQTPDYKAVHLSLADGLSQSSVMDIVQDRNGFVWMSTQDGLNRFNGKEFLVFREEPFDSNSISSNNLGPLHIDGQGRLWVGTVNNGLNLYNESTGHFTQFQHSDEPGSLSGNLITSITHDHLGNIWVGTTKGLNRVVEKKVGEQMVFSFDRIPLLLNDQDTSAFDYVFSVHADSSNKLWVGTYGGLFRIDLQKPLLPSPEYKAYSSELDNLSDYIVWDVLTDGNGHTWVGTRKGIDVIRSSTGELVRTINADHNNSSGMSSNLVHNMLYTSTGDLWVGYYDKGLQVVKKHFVENISTGLPEFEYPVDPEAFGLVSAGMNASLMEDHITPGMVWAGFSAAGALRFIPTTKKFYTSRLYGSGVGSSFVSSLVKDKEGFVWVGTTGGLVRHDRVNRKYIIINPPRKNIKGSDGSYVNGLATDQTGNIYFSSGMEVYEVRNPYSESPSAVQIPLPDREESGYVRTLYSGPDGNVYVLTRFALFVIDPSNNTVGKLMQVDDPVLQDDRGFFFSAVYMDEEGSVWLGASTGLYYYPSVNGNGFPDFSDPVIYTHDQRDTTSLRNHNILSINSDRNGHIWVGTFNGLSRMVGKGVDAYFLNFSTKDGLKNNMVYCILQDRNKGYLWLSTNNGLTEFDPLGKATATFDVHDGLQSNEFNSYAAFQSDDGELFFGGIEGYSSFYPGQIAIDKSKPLVNITRVLLNGSKEVLLEGSCADNVLRIPYQDNSFVVEFIGLHYRNPGENQYAYKLAGLEDDWIYTGTTPMVNFSKLPPGKYTFVVKAANNDGIYGEEASFDLIIRPPFHMTIWFYLSIAVLITGILWGLHKYRLSMKMAQMKEIDKIRKATAADFHDELGHKLTIINWFSQILKKKIGPEQADLKPHLDKIIETSGTLYHTMKDMLWAMDPDKDSVYDIYNQLSEFGQELFDNTGVTFESDDIPEDLREKLLSPAHKRHVLLIFKEVMNNSLKHAQGKSTHLSFMKEDEKVRFTFRDDGKGFVMNGQNVGNGLNNVKRRAKMINAEIRIKNDTVGTVAELEIPV